MLIKKEDLYRKNGRKRISKQVYETIKYKKWSSEVNVLAENKLDYWAQLRGYY